MRNSNGIAALLAIILLPEACCKKDNIVLLPSEYENVVIYYTDGYNNLTDDILDNVATICKGTLPLKSDTNALLWVTHNAVTSSDYNTPVSPVIIQIYSDSNGAAVLDTLMTFEITDRLVDKKVLTTSFAYIMGKYNSKHYGAVFSTHCTGWLPHEYYTKPKISRVGSYMLKSFGQSCEGTSGNIKFSHELEIPDFAEAIPMHLDYIIFDACLMGGVEVAYELKDCADVIGFSQAEVISYGFDYSTFSQRLLIEKDPVAFCRDYYELYEAKQGTGRSATVSVVSTKYLDKLASVCCHLFDKYHSGIESVNPDLVQGFFTDNRHWFYDLEDFLVKSGLGEEDHVTLSDALDDCILYEAHTDNMLGKFDINTSCGLTTFIPSNGTEWLRTYYKTLSWNDVTGLVK